MQQEITPQYLAEQRLSLDFPKRFWKKVRKTESCWIWTGNIGGARGTGYGQIVRGDYMGQIGAHVASWIMHNGPIPDGLCTLHNCPGGDNRACVNPAHLFLGTKGDNNRDTVKKGRFITAFGKGELSCMSKLKTEQVIKIKQMLKSKQHTTNKIGAMFGVNPSLISMIKSGKRWSHVVI